MQRGLVDDAIAHPIIAWMERYLMVCSSGETAYHVLIGKLLHGIVRHEGAESQTRHVMLHGIIMITRECNFSGGFAPVLCWLLGDVENTRSHFLVH